MWIATDEADCIFHEEGTTPFHKTHIVLHEIAHMLLDHRGGGAWQDLARLLAPDVDPGLARLILGRTAYTTVEEQEAETLAAGRTRWRSCAGLLVGVRWYWVAALLVVAVIVGPLWRRAFAAGRPGAGR